MSGCPQTLADDIGSKKEETNTSPKETMVVVAWAKGEAPTSSSVSSLRLRPWEQDGEALTLRPKEETGEKQRKLQTGGEEAVTRFIPVSLRGGTDPESPLVKP